MATEGSCEHTPSSTTDHGGCAQARRHVQAPLQSDVHISGDARLQAVPGAHRAAQAEPSPVAISLLQPKSHKYLRQLSAAAHAGQTITATLD